MGQPKAGVLLQGTPLYLPAWFTLTQLCTSAVVLGHGLGIPKEFQRLEDQYDGIGPLGGIMSLLLSGLGSHYLVLPCDMPGLTPEVVRPLLLPEHPLTTFAPPGGPLPLFLRGDLAPTLSHWVQSGGRSIRGFIQMCQGYEVPCPPGLWPHLGDVDSPQDLAGWENM